MKMSLRWVPGTYIHFLKSMREGNLIGYHRNTPFCIVLILTHTFTKLYHRTAFNQISVCADDNKNNEKKSIIILHFIFDTDLNVPLCLWQCVQHLAWNIDQLSRLGFYIKQNTTLTVTVS